MASITLSKTSSFLVFTVLLSLSPSKIDATDDIDHTFVKAMDPNTINLHKEKLSHFRFYWHDIISGKFPTSITVVQPPRNNSVNGFGNIQMIDNPLTVGPDLRSKMVGRAQGFYASASLEEVGLLMTMNFAFVEGKYNGSTITVMGRNPVFEAVREMPVIGGSGVFRWAKGYAQAKTHTFDFKSGDATVEYNVYVLHY